MKLAFALVAAVAGDIIRGASVTYDTYIRGGSSSSTNYNSATSVGWDGPISPVDSNTKAVLIKFDLSSLVGATLVPASPVWFYYKVSNGGDPGSLRELTVSWNHVCTSPTKTHAPLTVALTVALWLRPLPADASLSAPPCVRQATVTWTNLPYASSSWSATSIGGVGAVSGNTGLQKIDVTSSVAAWLAGTRTNHGWIVLPTGGNNGVDFHSSTTASSADTPYLDVPRAWGAGARGRGAAARVAAAQEEEAE